MTARGCRHAVVGYPGQIVRAAVEAGPREHRLPEIEGGLDFSELVTFWRLDRDGWEWFPPPLPDATVGAIYRWLKSSAQ